MGVGATAIQRQTGKGKLSNGKQTGPRIGIQSGPDSNLTKAWRI